MLSILMIIVLWTWGLTPLWVNIVGTILMVIRLTYRALEVICNFTGDDSHRDYYDY